jgi:4-hydroxy-3-methylbut-2-enyl diphosphate reductase
LIQKLVKEDYEIIIVGNKSHPEIKGIIGYCQRRNIVIGRVEEVKFLSYAQKRGVIAQTTQEITLFQEIVTKLIEKTEELRVFNTICESSKIRQSAAINLASQVDMMIVIGSRGSSNCSKLYNICKRIQPNTYFIEKAEQISLETTNHIKEIGIITGASTPLEIIEQIINEIKKRDYKEILVSKIKMNELQN